MASAAGRCPSRPVSSTISKPQLPPIVSDICLMYAARLAPIRSTHFRASASESPTTRTDPEATRKTLGTSSWPGRM